MPEPADLRLSPRQIECLRLAAEGQTSVEIAVNLGLSSRTVDQYVGDPATRLKETRNGIDRELQRRSSRRTSPITIRGGGDTRNAVALAPREECARRLGASHSKRMAASWSRSRRT